MYYRLYPNATTTIFKKGTGSSILAQGLINTGNNPISEIMDGSGQSTFLLGFDLTAILPKLIQYPSFTCNLQVYDAGTVFEPAIIPKPVDVLYFTDPFTEGEGYSFLLGTAVQGFANYNNSTALTPWGNALSQGNLRAFTIQKANEDWNIPVTSFITQAISASKNPNFGLRIAIEQTATASIQLVSGNIGDIIGSIDINGTQLILSSISFNSNLQTTVIDIVSAINAHTLSGFTAIVDPINNTNIIITPKIGLGATLNGIHIVVTTSGFVFTDIAFAGGVDSAYKFDPDNTYTKFMYTRNTRTIHQPYLEFFIPDEVVDGRYGATLGTSMNLYLLNDNGKPFVGALTGEIRDGSANLIATPIIVNPSPGVYYMTYNSNITDPSIIFDMWYIDGKLVAKNLVSLKSPNQILTNSDTSNLFFYPNTTYNFQTLRKSDIVRFNLISEIRGKGSVIQSGYEFRIISTSVFEMIPWTSVQTYNGKHYFVVDTSFLFPGIEYEVFVRLKCNEFTKTSQLTYRFRLQDNEANNLSTKNASPYNDRNDYLKQ